MIKRTPITTVADLVDCANALDFASARVQLWALSLQDDIERGAFVMEAKIAAHEANRLLDLLDAANLWRASISTRTTAKPT